MGGSWGRCEYLFFSCGIGLVCKGVLTFWDVGIWLLLRGISSLGIMMRQ